MAVNLLVIEDSALDYEVILATLAAQGIAANAVRVQTGNELESALQKQAWDAVISDHNLPGFSSGEALALHHSLLPAVRQRTYSVRGQK